MAYRPDLILLVNFDDDYNRGRVSTPSVDQIPLIDFGGLSYISSLTDFEAISDYDRDQMSHVVHAYGDFPVHVKCTHKGGECGEEAETIVLPWERVRKHEKQGGPAWRKQIYIEENPFYCRDCAEEVSHEYGRGTRGKGTESLPISFSILDRPRRDWNLDRTQLHMRLKKLAYQLRFQETGDLIDTGDMYESSRMYFNREEAKEVVNKLLGVPSQIDLFESPESSGFRQRELFMIRRVPDRERNVPGLNL